MTWMNALVKANEKIWDQCIDTPFVQSLLFDRMPDETFKHYMIQDSIYLRYYARVLGQGLYCAEKMHEIQVFYQMLGVINDTETETRLSYLKPYHITDADMDDLQGAPANQAYIDYLMNAAQTHDWRIILMAALPCMLSYRYVFQKLSQDECAQHVRYWSFIQDYANEAYSQLCDKWILFADQACTDMTEDKKMMLAELFTVGSRHELSFWQMAGASLNDEHI